MADVCVTVPKWFWAEWIAEGDCASEPWSGETWGFYLGGRKPKIEPGERVYIVAHGRLRGYSPLLALKDTAEDGKWFLERGGGAVAVTLGVPGAIPRPDGTLDPLAISPIRGFQGWRYRFWERDREFPYPDWRVP